MKRYLILALLAAAAAVPGYRVLTTEPVPSEPVRVAEVLSPAEKGELVEISTEVLNHAVRFRSDGTANASYLAPQLEAEFEWRGLVLRQVIIGQVSDDDRAEGVECRYYAQLDAASHRLLRSETWSPWKAGLGPFFPGYILIERVDGQLRASAPKLASFHPGPHGSSDAPAALAMAR